MITEALDFRYLLIENYKKLKMSEKELATILVMDHLINTGNKFVTVDLLSLKMSLDAKEIDEIFAKMLTKGYIVIKTVGKKTIHRILQNYMKIHKETCMQNIELL